MAVESLLVLTEEHNLKTYTDLDRVFANWARGKLHDPEGGAVGLEEALASYLALGNRSGGPWFHGLLADLEAMRPDLDSALAAIDAGLALAEETGEHYTDPHLHQLRGDFLMMVSRRLRSRRGSIPDRHRGGQGQGARGYVLMASHALAKLHQARGRPDAAKATLAPALEGFSPTPEMPEIGEAQGLLRRLA